MSQTLRIDNFGSSNVREKTYLDADVAAAATSLTVKSTQGAAGQLFTLVGGLNQESTELSQITSVTAPSTLALSAALAYGHEKYDAVLILNANQLNIYRAEATGTVQPADASFALVATVDIDPDQLETITVDEDGGEGYWYKFTYYNSITEAETPLSSAIAVRGGGSHEYASLNDIRREAGFEGNENVPYSEIDRHRQAAEDEINATLRSRYEVPFTDVPPLVTRICTLLAAGNLLSNEYERFEDYQTDRGSGKRKEARMYLMKLKTGEMDLFDEDGEAVDAESDVRGYPDASAGEPKFTIDMRF